MIEFDPREDRVLLKPTPPEKFRAGIELFGADIQPEHEGTIVHPGFGKEMGDMQIHINADLNPESAKILMDGIQQLPTRRLPLYKAGDYVMYGKYAGTKVVINEEEHVILRESDIFGVIR